MDTSCKFSFDDLHRAVFGRPMAKQERKSLYSLAQSDRNKIVGEWARKVSWRVEERVGTDGVTYTAFWPSDLGKTVQK